MCRTGRGAARAGERDGHGGARGAPGRRLESSGRYSRLGAVAHGRSRQIICDVRHPLFPDVVRTVPSRSRRLGATRHAEQGRAFRMRRRARHRRESSSDYGSEGRGFDSLRALAPPAETHLFRPKLGARSDFGANRSQTSVSRRRHFVGHATSLPDRLTPRHTAEAARLRSPPRVGPGTSPAGR